MPAPLTRRHVLAGAAATAAVAAMPAGMAIAAVKQAPAKLAGWAFVVNDVTRPLLAGLPVEFDRGTVARIGFELIGETHRVGDETGPHRWVAVNVIDDKLQIVGAETWSRRQALIDAGWKLEALS